MTPVLVAKLRSATREAHQALEDGLGLLAPPLSLHRFRHVLARFYGFHAVWEPAMAEGDGTRALLEGRRRLHLLEQDLGALDLRPEEIAALPRCTAAAALADTRARALGSLYVLEGSTLGGRVIARALEGASWTPAGGLRYFTAHGERTGAMWRAVQLELEGAAEAERPEVVAGALATFGLLHAWVAEPASVLEGGA